MPVARLGGKLNSWGGTPKSKSTEFLNYIVLLSNIHVENDGNMRVKESRTVSYFNRGRNVSFFIFTFIVPLNWLTY